MMGYGITETTAWVFGTVGPRKWSCWSNRKAYINCQAKIVDPDSLQAGGALG